MDRERKVRKWKVEGDGRTGDLGNGKDGRGRSRRVRGRLDREGVTEQGKEG